jgi:hypothetical protein
MNRFLLSYLTPRDFESELYSSLAVDRFLLVTPLMLWARISRKKKPIVTSKRSALKYFRETVFGELSHLASLMLLLAASFFAFSIGQPLPDLLDETQPSADRENTRQRSARPID